MSKRLWPAGDETASWLPPAWPFLALFGLFPLWWALGLGTFIWPVLAVPMLARLRRRPGWRAPPAFLIWLLFLGWVGLSVVQVSSLGNVLTYLFRASAYLSATIVFLFVLNMPRRQLPTSTVVNLLIGFWAMVVLGGWLGLLLPHVSFSTVTQSLVPASALRNRWLYELVHPSLAQVQTFIGYSISRPAAPFAYTNWWGGNFGVLIPFVFAGLQQIVSRRIRLLLWLLLAVSIVPVVVSVNRGLWLSLGVGLLYGMARLAARARKAGFVVAGMVLLLGGVILGSPLLDVVSDRLDHPGSKDLRVSLYKESISGVMKSPILGHGVPLPQPESKYILPNVGTQGQLWLVLVCTGIPGLTLFLGWLWSAFWRSRAGIDGVAFWAHVSILIALVQLPFYGMLPVEIHIVMIAAALVWREADRPDERDHAMGRRLRTGVS